jgi:hypothetical protein
MLCLILRFSPMLLVRTGTEFFFFKTGSPYIAQTGLELTVLLLQPSKS